MLLTNFVFTHNKSLAFLFLPQFLRRLFFSLSDDSSIFSSLPFSLYFFQPDLFQPRILLCLVLHQSSCIFFCFLLLKSKLFLFLGLLLSRGLFVSMFLSFLRSKTSKLFRPFLPLLPLLLSLLLLPLSPLFPGGSRLITPLSRRLELLHLRFQLVYLCSFVGCLFPGSCTPALQFFLVHTDFSLNFVFMLFGHLIAHFLFTSSTC
mmetsp:Transcript_19876/g.33451  ORF Transcript_19876/g.33451 Transcript_19876/m.33451 type:complete len:205 (+) Transcript_19876:1219-1833(+)